MLSRTGEGYVYIRDRARGNDKTVYLSQLALLRAGVSGFDVFAPETEAHHVYPVLEWNEPENVRLVDVREHNELHGRPARPALTDGGEQ